jgi:hypothetical protein
VVSGPSPFAAGCPGAAFDATMIAGQELEPSITVNPANPRNIVAAWIQDAGPQSSRAAGWLRWKRSRTCVRVRPPGLCASAARMSVASGSPVVWASAQAVLRAA